MDFGALRLRKKKDNYSLDRSRATEPLYYWAPSPPGDRQPYQFQFAGAEYCLDRDNALIGDEPGLGKTNEAILVSNAIEANRTLVVCPASLRLNWQREIWQWATIPNVSVYPVEKARDGVSDRADYVVISYDLLRNDAVLNAIMDLRWDHLILDEAHALKDPKGNQRTRVICAPDLLPSVVGRKTMLSGTILPNQPIECYNAARLLDWSAIDRMSLADFREAYYTRGEGFVRKRVCVDPDNDVWTWKLVYSDDVLNVPCNLADLQDRLRKRIMVRRLKSQVMNELPPLQWHLFPIEASTALRQALGHPGWQAAEKLYDIDPDAFEVNIPVDGATSTARRLVGEAAAPAVASYIEDLLEAGATKVVVAAWHTTVLDYLIERLKPYGLVRMMSGMSDRAKDKSVQDFQNNDAVQVIIGQTLVIGEGHTLTAAQDIVLAEPDWVPGKNEQVANRIHRWGQKGTFLQAHVPIVPGSLQEKIMGRAVQKAGHIHDALDRDWGVDN